MAMYGGEQRTQRREKDHKLRGEERRGEERRGEEMDHILYRMNG
jgi:hypothetical protein